MSTPEAVETPKPVRILVYPSTRQLVKVRAAKAGLTMAEWLHRLLLNGGQEPEEVT